MFKKIQQRIWIYKQMHKALPEFNPTIKDPSKKNWEDATEAEKAEVIEKYNKYYCEDGDKLTLKKANQTFKGRRWITIKYTWGVEPV